MSRVMTLNVRISGELGDHVAWNIGDDGQYESVSEYVRDLIRHDRARKDEERFQALKAELQAAFAEPDDNAETISGPDFLARIKRRGG